MYNSPLPDVIPTEPPFDHMHDDHEGFTQPANAHLHSERPSLQSQIEELRQEVSILKNVISASFDLQLDIQRSIRQEVSAALNSSRPVREIETSACTDIGGEQRSRAAAAGMCTVCLEKRVDSLLYGCGHMCTCVMCGRQVIAGGLGCPICRAPVRDVVRAYVVTE